MDNSPVLPLSNATGRRHESFYIWAELAPFLAVYLLATLAIKFLLGVFLFQKRKSKRWFVAKTLLACNKLITALYGGKYGVIRERRRDLKRDDLGRQVMYYNEYEIPEDFVFLPCMLAIKCVVLLSFMAFFFLDVFLVRSSVGCDAGKDCYLQKPSLDGFPITDCSDVINNPKYTSVCYELVYDVGTAAASVGGLTTFSTYALTISAGISIFIVEQIQWGILKFCCTCSLPKVFFFAQFCFFSIVFWLCVWLSSGCLHQDTTLHMWGCIIRRLAYVSLLLVALMVPWYQLVIYRNDQSSYMFVEGTNQPGSGEAIQDQTRRENNGGQNLVLLSTVS